MRILSTLFNTLALISFIILISCSNSDKSKQTISDQVSDIEDIKNEFDEKVMAWRYLSGQKLLIIWHLRYYFPNNNK